MSSFFFFFKLFFFPVLCFFTDCIAVGVSHVIFAYITKERLCYGLSWRVLLRPAKRSLLY